MNTTVFKGLEAIQIFLVLSTSFHQISKSRSDQKLKAKPVFSVVSFVALHTEPIYANA